MFVLVGLFYFVRKKIISSQMMCFVGKFFYNSVFYERMKSIFFLVKLVYTKMLISSN